MLFRRKTDLGLLRHIHSQQKKTVRCISFLEKLCHGEKADIEPVFSNLFNHNRELFNHIIDEVIGREKNSIFASIALSYHNLNTHIYIFTKTALSEVKNMDILRDYTEFLRELLEIYESVIFHIFEHPNLARENFGKRDIFLENIYELLQSDKTEHDRWIGSFISITLSEMNNIELSLKKLIY